MALRFGVSAAILSTVFVGQQILHSEAQTAERSEVFRQGVAMNDVPPVVIHVPTERTAIGRAVRMVRPNDVLLVLADQPATVARAVARAGEAKGRQAEGAAHRRA